VRASETLADGPNRATDARGTTKSEATEQRPSGLTKRAAVPVYNQYASFDSPNNPPACTRHTFQDRRSSGNISAA
jgi:hypothetical protein